jgi:serine phosphatase RsbU (regulator of sigma subunit)
MERSSWTRHGMPVTVLLLVSLVDVLLGPEQVVLGLVVIAPLVAASSLGRRATAGYAVAALGLVGVLGVYDRQYTDDAIVAQSVRLAGVVLGGAFAVAASGLRQQRERDVARLGLESASAQAEARDSARLAQLVDVARALGDSRTPDDVLQVVEERGLALLGARGAVLLLVGTSPGAEVSVSTTFHLAEPDMRIAAGTLSRSGLAAATAGEAVFVPDREQALRRWPAARPWYEATGTDASCLVPVRLPGLTTVLWVAWAEPHAFARVERRLVETLAAQCAQTLARIEAREREQAASREVHQLAETLQRSLLTEPPQLASLAVAVRYLPAAAHAQVGGDWYDAFTAPDGSTVLVIGDVAGHDGSAAATMAQARGVLRGIAQTVPGSPAAVLAALDRAMEQLRMNTLMTVVMAVVEERACPDRGGAGVPWLRWSNAGHPPPVLLRADGRVQLLEHRPDRLLGVAPGARRADHEVELADGDTVVFYTDGLMERRGVSLDAGTAWLLGRMTELVGAGIEQLCDLLLQDMAGRVEDDVALIAVRVRAG